jgi:hypothetical protein
MKLFSAQKKREIEKLLKFLELMKAMFDCGRNKAATKGNSMHPRKDDFLKVMMQSSHFFKRDTRLDHS